MWMGSISSDHSRLRPVGPPDGVVLANRATHEQRHSQRGVPDAKSLLASLVHGLDS
jgi:hypothetical protein